MSGWIDFKKLRGQLDNEQVLADYGVKLTGNGEQRRAPCPLPNHPDDSGAPRPFSVNMTKGIWRCFSCGARGNMIDFTALMEGLDPEVNEDVRKAAFILQKKYVGEQTERLQTGKKSGRRSQQPKRQVRSGAKRQVNPPLDFMLKSLDPNHECFAKLGLDPVTVDNFGLGYCTRGTLAGKVAIPLYDASGSLIGYAGLDDGNDITFPADRERNGVEHVFDRSRFVYNGHRIEETMRDLLVTSSIPLAWKLWQAGWKNVVSTMGDACSHDQACAISNLTYAEGHVWLLTTPTDDGDDTAESAIAELASLSFTRHLVVNPASIDANTLPLPACR